MFIIIRSSSPFIFVSVLIGRLLSEVSLKIETNVVEIGKNIRFDCFISDLSKRRSRQWIGGPDNGLLSFNGVSSNPKKYKETEINATYFTLQVFNITEDDLNCPYACRYGFKSDEMVLKVNEQTFKYIPQSSEIQALYTMENGAYSLRINISRVFPTPVCSLVTSKEEHRLKETLTDKDGIFEKVSYFVTSKSPMHDCSSPIKVVCNISDEVLAIPVTHSLGCPARDQSSTMEDKQNVTVIYIVVPIVALLITGIICIIIGYRYRCTQYIQASTNSELNGI